MYADYAFYTDVYGGSGIPEEDWPRLSARADVVIDALTYGRLQRGWEVTDAVRMACCSVAEELNRQEENAAARAALAAGVKSENNDGYSVTFGDIASAREAALSALEEAAGWYLPASDPLRYAGLYCGERRPAGRCGPCCM